MLPFASAEMKLKKGNVFSRLFWGKKKLGKRCYLNYKHGVNKNKRWQEILV